MRRVLITGSAGFVGSHLVEHLLKNTNWEIVGIDSFKHKGDSLRVKRDDRYTVHYHDLNAPIGYRLSHKIGCIDYIMNIASDSHVDRSITHPIDCITNNTNLICNILEFARQVKPKVFMQMSTDEVYGPAPIGVDHEEWSTILPSNPYSASKAAQEAICYSYWRSYGLPLIITNTMNIVGERQDPEKFLPLLIKRIYHGEEIEIHGTRKFIGSRYYLHARNLADALLYLVNDSKNKHFDLCYQNCGNDKVPKPQRFNIVGEMELNNLELANYVANYMGKELNFKLLDFHHSRPGHDSRYALDGSKLFNLGWRPPVPLMKSIEKAIDWTLKKENKEWLL